MKKMKPLSLLIIVLFPVALVQKKSTKVWKNIIARQLIKTQKQKVSICRSYLR